MRNSEDNQGPGRGRRRGGPGHPHDHPMHDHPMRPGGRRRRGEIRAALLAVLVDGPRHGYDAMRALEERSGGAWRPSAGSVYPTLQQLEDEGLVSSTEQDGKRTFSLTDAGRAAVAAREAEGGQAPWAGGEGAGLRGGVMALHQAARQVGAVGTPEQVEKAIAIVTDARKALYLLLADA